MATPAAGQQQGGRGPRGYCVKALNLHADDFRLGGMCPGGESILSPWLALAYAGCIRDKRD